MLSSKEANDCHNHSGKQCFSIPSSTKLPLTPRDTGSSHSTWSTPLLWHLCSGYFTYRLSRNLLEGRDLISGFLEHLWPKGLNKCPPLQVWRRRHSSVPGDLVPAPNNNNKISHMFIVQLFGVRHVCSHFSNN
jgi:hypothetical protein